MFRTQGAQHGVVNAVVFEPWLASSLSIMKSNLVIWIGTSALISFLDELAKNHTIDPVCKAIKSQGAQQNKRVGKKMTGRSALLVFA